MFILVFVAGKKGSMLDGIGSTTLSLKKPYKVYYGLVENFVVVGLCFSVGLC